MRRSPSPDFGEVQYPQPTRFPRVEDFFGDEEYVPTEFRDFDQGSENGTVIEVDDDEEEDDDGKKTAVESSDQRGSKP